MQNIYHYQNNKRVFLDVQDLIIQFKFQPKTDYFLMNNQKQLLLTLNGVINNMELSVWIPLEYPILLPILAPGVDRNQFRNLYNIFDNWNENSNLVMMFNAIKADLLVPMVPARPPKITGFRDAQKEFSSRQPSLHHIPPVNAQKSLEQLPPVTAKQQERQKQDTQAVRDRVDILTKVESAMDKLQSDVANQTRINAQLMQNNANLINCKAELENLLQISTRNSEILSFRIQNLSTELLHLKQKPDFNPDDNIYTKSVVEQQYKF